MTSPCPTRADSGPRAVGAAPRCAAPAVFLLPLLGALLLVTGCGDKRARAEAWPRLEAEALAGPEHERRLAEAMQARDAMFGRLLTTLITTMGEAGPAGSIEVCSVEAPRIAGEISARHDVRIGRTSWKLRNPKNAPPTWAKPLVAQRIEEDAGVIAPDGTLGVLLPIRLSPTCLACHGPKDRIAPDVRAALAARYPDDAATGFRAGDLRGWFWVEVPPRE